MIVGNYPPGVTGNEWQICGSGLEDKCERCMDKADPETRISAIPDGVEDVGGAWLCGECLAEVMTASACCGEPLTGSDEDPICSKCKEHV